MTDTPETVDTKRLNQAEALGLPERWRVGQKVRYIRSIDWGPSRGDVGTVVEVRNPNTPGHEYQVFWVGFGKSGGKFWTTPDDVELVEDTNG